MTEDVVGQLALQLNLQTDSLSKQIRSAASGAQKTATSSFASVGKAAAGAFAAYFSVKAIVGFTKSCLSLGSDLTEVQNVVDTTFTSMSNQVNRFATDAMSQFGMSETVAKKYMGTLGAMSKSMGFTESASYDMASAVTGLAGDVASFYNMSTDEAYTKLKSIWTGETETLKEIGVLLTQTNLDQYALNNGFGKTTAQMTEQEKVMLRYQYTMSALGAAQGDFAKTSDSWANQTRVLSLRFDVLKATLGQGMISVLTPLIKYLNEFVAYLSKGAEAFTSFVQAITGTTPEASSNLSSMTTGALDTAAAVSSVGDAAEKTAKQIEKSLTGFDEINKISEPNDDSKSPKASSDNGVNAGALNTATDSLLKEKSTPKWLDNFKSKMSGLLTYTKKKLNPGIESIADTFKSTWKDIKSLKNPVVDWMNSKEMKKLGTTAMESLLDIVNMRLLTISNLFGTFWNNIFPVLNKFITVGLPVLTQFYTNWINLFTQLYTTLYTGLNTCITDMLGPLLSVMSDCFCGMIDSMAASWATFGQPIFDGLSEAVSNTADIFNVAWTGTFKPIFDHFIETLRAFLSEHIKPFADNVLGLIGELSTCILTLYNKCIAPVVSWVAQNILPLITPVINSMVDKAKIGIGWIVDSINSIVSVIRSVVRTVSRIASGDWKGAWQSFKDIFGNIWSSMTTLAKGPINIILGFINGLIDGAEKAINFVISGLNKLSFSVPGWVPGIGGKSFGVDISHVDFGGVPYLANGGYVKANTPQLAMIGDNRHQGEVVAPEDKLTEMAMQAVREANSSGMTAAILEVLKQILAVLKALDLDIVIDGKKLKDIIVAKINENTKSTGVCEILT